MNLLSKSWVVLLSFSYLTCVNASIEIDTNRDKIPFISKTWIDDFTKNLSHVYLSSIEITNTDEELISIENVKLSFLDVAGTSFGESNFDKKFINKRKVSKYVSKSGFTSHSISSNNGAIYVSDYAGSNLPKEPIQLSVGGPNLFKRPSYSTNGYIGQKETLNLMDLHLKTIDNNEAKLLKIEVTYSDNNETKFETKVVELIKAVSVGKYIFPVKGTWKVSGGWYGEGDYHRSSYSEEFALDLEKVTIDQEGKPQIEKNDGVTIGNYNSYSFGSELVAMADGVVVDIVSDISDTDSHKDPSGISGNYFHGRDNHWKPQLVFEKYGIKSFFLGNIITIKHNFNGVVEYSYYGHLKRDSIRVQIGDRVKQGDVIALVGNSGNSSGAHLHFLVNTHQDPKYGYSLPMVFTNIDYIDGSPVEYGYLKNNESVRTR